MGDLSVELEMAYHNLLCYSKNYLMSEPKEGWEHEWQEAKARVMELEKAKGEE